MEAKQRRHLIWWMVAGGGILILLVALAGREPPPQVTAAQVTRGALSATITSNGKVEAIEPHTLRAPLDTFVSAVHAVEGQAVRRGQLLLELEVSDARAQLARAREELLAAEEELRAARAGGAPEEVAQLESDLRKTSAELDRLRRERSALERLLARQAATRDELDQNKLALERAEAQWKLLQERKADLDRRAKLDVERAALRVERARSEIRALEQKVAAGRVVAPADSTLYSLPVRPQAFVRTGDLLAELADLRRVRVRVFVDEPELGALEKGQRVEITWEALSQRSWTGVTELIPKAVVPRGGRSVGELLCTIENEKVELLPNVNVNARIRLRERAEALAVPRGAVRTEGTKRYVFVIEGNRLRRQEIQIGISSATHHEVLTGLKDGERVALPGDIELKDGMTVRVREAG